MRDSEKRHFLRIPCELELSIKSVGGDPKSEPLLAIIKDISRGGIRIRVDHYIPLSDILKCHLKLPGYPKIELQVMPAWRTELPHLGCYDMGVRFINASEEAQETIQDFEYELLLKTIIKLASWPVSGYQHQISFKNNLRNLVLH